MVLSISARHWYIDLAVTIHLNVESGILQAKALELFCIMKLILYVQAFAGLLLSRSCQAARQDSGNDFLDPPAVQRPRFRYWLPDGTLDPEKVKSDIQSASKIGAGGAEFLPFYNYGGQLGPPPVGVNWSTSGFGTPNFIKTLIAGLEAHNESGLSMDFAIGPNQGQGVPADASNEGLQWDLVS